MRAAGRELCTRHRTAFLLKGGHLRGEAVDLLVTPDGQVAEFSAPRVPGVATHGTGCTFSAAIAAGLAKGLPLGQAVAQGKRFVTGAIRSHFVWVRPDGQGETDALNHGISEE
jgi:hydroxymethylpyrimidine kinase/phosphomethylpyrimidine kinase